MLRRFPSRVALAALLALVLSVPASAQVNAIIMDMADDGIDLSGVTTTTLVHGLPTATQWTTPMSDDCFLMLDATSIRSAGYTVEEGGATLDGLVMFRDGLRITDPGGKEKIIADGWEMLQAFDANADGFITAADPVFDHLWLFMDDDLDGLVSAVGDELHRPPTPLLSWGTGIASQLTDPQGNVRKVGSWFENGDIPHELDFVDLREIPVPVRATTWGAIKAGRR